VKTAGRFALVLALGVCASPVRADALKRPHELERLNRRLHGQVLDYTSRHDGDRRLWSEALQQKRDLYVYLPPHFDPGKRYPLILWLHGFAQDEHSFIQYVAEPLDRVMAEGQLPPAIVAAPDGSLDGNACFRGAGSFFLNTRAGRFEDYLMQDVWTFLHQTFPIRPEPEAHVLAGVSMGGGAAYHLGIKYRDRVKVVVGFFPPVNTRWQDCRGRYFGNFDPHCWGWRTDTRNRHEVVGRFYGVVTVRLRQLLEPLYGGADPEQTLAEISRENPIEMLGRLDLRPGELEMFIAYGAHDEFNIDAQVESFLYVAERRGLCVGVAYDPHGHHNLPTARRLFPDVVAWLAPRLAPYSP
jgi:S-formylglutathione hydrolase FrmB